jgi:fatty acid desaturase
MKPLVALSLSLGLLAAVATWVSLTVGLLVWAIFLAWASFYHCGGDLNALKNSITNNLFGAILGWLCWFSPLTSNC